MVDFKTLPDFVRPFSKTSSGSLSKCKQFINIIAFLCYLYAEYVQRDCNEFDDNSIMKR